MVGGSLVRLITINLHLVAFKFIFQRCDQSSFRCSSSKEISLPERPWERIHHAMMSSAKAWSPASETPQSRSNKSWMKSIKRIGDKGETWGPPINWWHMTQSSPALIWGTLSAKDAIHSRSLGRVPKKQTFKSTPCAKFYYMHFGCQETTWWGISVIAQQC